MNKISRLMSIRLGVAMVSIIALSLVVMSIPALTQAQVLTRELSMGMNGTDVSSLQTFLAKDNTIYPQGRVTGYFGFLTKAAVSNFQSRNGIATVGRVGPITMAAINAQMSGTTYNNGSTNTGGRAPSISNVSLNANKNSVTANWVTDTNAKGVLYYNSSPLGVVEHLNSVDITGNVAMNDSQYRTTQSIMAQGLQSNTTYYYMIYSTDQNGNVSVTWPSTFHTSN